jgi:hypothetical protein
MALCSVKAQGQLYLYLHGLGDGYIEKATCTDADCIHAPSGIRNHDLNIRDVQGRTHLRVL